MAITKKEGKELARLMNDVVVWGTAVCEGIGKKSSDDIRQFMSWHNTSGRKINEMLKTTAVHLYVKHETGEEY
jgi:hypothetical protein